jgi:NAD(P)-dependent dehydrogenase (short-subunit alcohol dehydrogenase family)
MGYRLKEKGRLFREQARVGLGWGTGKATAVLFAREGARVLAIETKQIIEREGGICEAVAGNVSLAEDVAAAVGARVAEFGQIDVRHNNVGITGRDPEDSWDRVNDLNLKSVFLTCKQVLPHMEKQRKGVIVNIASVWGIR